jgi:hypothetical protein
MKRLAEKLISLEHFLNERNVIPIGSLLADYWREVYSRANGEEIKNLPVYSTVFIFLKQNCAQLIIRTSRQKKVGFELKMIHKEFIMMEKMFFK